MLGGIIYEVSESPAGQVDVDGLLDDLNDLVADVELAKAERL